MDYFKRGSGILLHITSLPSQYGIGDLGPSAYRFADYLASARQTYWQVLPLNPTNPACMHSPYSSTSAFAGNPLLISPEILAREGLLSDEEAKCGVFFKKETCNFVESVELKEKLFTKAYKNFKSSKVPKDDYKKFCQDNSSWLDDYSLFHVIRRENDGRMWTEWKAKLRDRSKKDLALVKKEAKDEIDRVKFLQYIFFKQLSALKNYCNNKGISLIGDIPIYVSYDSADCWANTDIFKLDEKKQPTFVAGVPPDYFSKTGQLWGNPVYNWDRLKETEFSWWTERIRQNLAMFDVVRIDHFRGLVSYWEVPQGEQTAINGKWVHVPSKDLFDTLLKNFHKMQIIAEDLGIITQDVRDILKHYKFPGMKVLLFAFGENNPFHPYLPHVYGFNWVVYTGTHDNNTVRGWFENESNEGDRNRFFRYIGRDAGVNEVNWEFIRLALMSVARIAIFPMQDVLGLGSASRMNTPSTTEGNWLWRVTDEQLNNEGVRNRLAELTCTYGRA